MDHNDPARGGGTLEGHEAASRHADEAMRRCPNCGETLRDRSCKLACPNPLCGFFLSCSDFL